MGYVDLVIGFVAGAVVGIGGVIYYLRYRTRKQLEMMNEMGGMFQDLDLEQDSEPDEAA